MLKPEKINEILEEINGAIIMEITSAETGSLYLIDELYRVVVQKTDIERMYTDKVFYKSQGGWDGFTRENNKRNIETYMKMLDSCGYEIDNVDMINDGTLFLNIKQHEIKKD